MPCYETEITRGRHFNGARSFDVLTRTGATFLHYPSLMNVSFYKNEFAGQLLGYGMRVGILCNIAFIGIEYRNGFHFVDGWTAILSRFPSYNLFGLLYKESLEINPLGVFQTEIFGI